MRICTKLVIVLLAFIIIPVGYISSMVFFNAKTIISNEIMKRVDIIADQDREEVFAPIDRLRNLLIFIVFVAVISAALAAIAVARSISAPIKKLKEGVKIIGTGDLKHRVAINLKDEIGELSRAFDAMAYNLGRTTTSVGILNREIAEKAKIEKFLKQSEERFRILFESSCDAIMTLEPPYWLFTSCNSATVNMFQTKDETEFISKKPYELSPEYQPDGRPSKDKALDMINTAMEKGFNSFEWVHRRASGDDFYATVLLTKVNIGDKEFLEATVRDISDIKKSEMELRNSLKEAVKSREIMTSMLEDNNEIRERLEKSLKELEETHLQLIQSGKMASLGQMAGGIAHEINNPLTGVLNNVQIIKLEAETKKDMFYEEYKGLLDIIEESALRCKRITQSLLDFSHSSKKELAPVSLNEIAEKVIFLISSEMKFENISLEKILQPDLPVIPGDPQLLQQVVFNLISNAKWAIGKRPDKARGTITVKTEHETGKGDACISVTDTGIGISKENLPKIFEPFFSTKEVGEGTGLGLPIVYGVVTRHKGTIAVDSEVGVGTTFKISLPLVPK